MAWDPTNRQEKNHNSQAFDQREFDQQVAHAMFNNQINPRSIQDQRVMVKLGTSMVKLRKSMVKLGKSMVKLFSSMQQKCKSTQPPGIPSPVTRQSVVPVRGPASSSKAFKVQRSLSLLMVLYSSCSYRCIYVYMYILYAYYIQMCIYIYINAYVYIYI